MWLSRWTTHDQKKGGWTTHAWAHHEFIVKLSKTLKYILLDQNKLMRSIKITKVAEALAQMALSIVS